MGGCNQCPALGTFKNIIFRLIRFSNNTGKADMGYLKFLFTATFGFCCLQFCSAQNGYNYATFTAANGPVSSEISTLFQDRQNFLWIGHNAGITRYDGVQFEDFLFAENHQVGKAYSFAEGSHGDIWIGTELGLFLWKNEHLHFIETGAYSRPVYALCFDRDGGLWIGNSDGPFYIPENHLTFIVKSFRTDLAVFRTTAWNQQFPNGNFVKFITLGDNHGIFFGDGYIVYQYVNNQIIPIWESTGRLDQLNGIWARNKDTIFVCSLSLGIQVVEQGVLRKNERHTFFTKQMLVNDGLFYQLTNDGIYQVDPFTLDARKIMEIPDFANRWGTCLLKDNEQNFWIGSNGQLNYSTRNFFTNLRLRNNESPRDFYSIFQFPNKDIVFGANKGESFIKGRNDSTLRLWKHLFPHSAITGFHEEKNGGLWVSSSYEGLAHIQGGKVKTYTRKDGLRDNTNFFFLENARQELFTAGDAGVTQIIQLQNGAASFKNFRYSTGSSDYVVIKSGIATNDGQLLFGSNRGLFILKKDSLVPVIISGAIHQMHNITDMKMDSNGDIWISTLGDGILVCTLNGETIQLKDRLTPKEGLPSQIILQILIDHTGDIWAADYNAVFKIEKTSTGEYFVSQYERNESRSNMPYYNIKMFQSEDGKIWLASTIGISNFDPVNKMSKVVPVLNLIDIVTSYNSKIIDTMSLQQGNILDSKVNSIRFNFRGISFSNPGAVRYSYRLIGADSQWTVARRSQTAIFRNLSPGHYSFEVKAYIVPNQWGNTIRYDFIIERGFWHNPWVVTISSILGAAMLYLLGLGWKGNIQRRADDKVKAQKAIADNLQYRLETERIITYFALSISEKKTEEELVWDVVKNCIAQLGFEDCVIYLSDSARNVLVQKAAWGPKTNQWNIIVNPIEIPIGKGIVGNVAQNKKAEIIKDVNIDPRYIVDDVHRSSEIAVPILAGETLLGVIDSEHSRKDFYTQRHLQILSTIASLCADKITIIRTIAEKRKAEVEGMISKQKATEARLQSMRLQMNPHFLFNSLNSIQQMILTGEENLATRSLSKFSRLLRMVLILSENDKISLARELEMLQLYIDLESQRFRESFQYSIQCDPSIDKEETQVPTMLIQPFVENAIWHGLMHKEGLRKLSIQFNDEGNFIICTIEDNGIGRFASQHIKENSVVEGHHAGKAIALASERLNISGTSSLKEENLQIIDEKDELGNATGTKVIIRFPA